MILYFLRHASAGGHLANAKKDEKRALDKEGMEQCGYIGRALAALDVQVDAIVSSPLKRALQTAQFVGTELGFEGKVEISPALALNADFAAFQQMLAKHAGYEGILVVGHNPNLTGFVGSLLVPVANCPAISLDGRNGIAPVRLRKGSLARLNFTRGPATLQWLLDPRTVRALYATSTAKSRRKTSRK